MLVAVAAKCVGTVDGILIALEGGKSLSFVAVGTALQVMVMSTHLLIGSAVTIVIMRGFQKQRVDAISHRDIGTIHYYDSQQMSHRS